MFAANRREERRKDIVTQLANDFSCTTIEDLGEYEIQNIFLEGTGSMVLDHDHKKIYACISERTHPALLNVFADKTGYDVIAFNAADNTGMPIYHTNVMMCIGYSFSVVCTEVIDPSSLNKVIVSLAQSNKPVIEISYPQMLQFAGNMLQVQNAAGELFLVMSASAFTSLNKEQLATLQQHTRILPVSIPTIEAIGGGSARCMMTEIFLTKKPVTV